MCYYPSKHSSWWRDTEDVFNVTFFCLPRRLEGIIARRLEDVLEDVLKTPWRRLARRLEDVLKTSWRHFRKTYCKHVLKTSGKRLQQVLEDEKCYAEDVLKTCWRLLGKLEMFAGYIFDIFWKKDLMQNGFLKCKDPKLQEKKIKFQRKKLFETTKLHNFETTTWKIPNLFKIRNFHNQSSSRNQKIATFLHFVNINFHK